MEYTIAGNSLGIFSLIVLLFLFSQAETYYSNDNPRHKNLWLKFVATALLLQLLSILAWSLMGTRGIAASIVLHICIFLGIVLLSFFAALAALFVEYSIDFSDKCLKKLNQIFIPSAIVNIILAILSIPFGLYYKITPDNYCVKGDFYFVLLALSFLPMVVILLRMVFVHEQEGALKRILIASMFSPIVAAILETSDFIVIPIVFPAITLSILFLHLFLVNNSIYKDFLTGLQNKNGLQKYFDSQTLALNSYVAVIYIDLNSFKKINDTYGHNEGDQALCAFSKIISSTSRKSDLLARIGGDEFLIATTLGKPEDVDNIISRIKNQVAHYNKTSQKPYELSISYGASVCPANKDFDIEELIGEADNKMYLQKNAYHKKYQA